MVLNVHRNRMIRLIRDEEKGSGGGGWGGSKGGMEVGKEGDYNHTYLYTVTTRMTPALRWAAMRAILMFH